MRRKPVDVDPVALREFSRATAWFDAEQDGLGQKFARAVASALERISEAPASCSPVRGAEGVRSVRAKPFHHRLYFMEEGARLRVIAIAPPSRGPDYWRRRLGGTPRGSSSTLATSRSATDEAIGGSTGSTTWAERRLMRRSRATRAFSSPVRARSKTTGNSSRDSRACETVPMSASRCSDSMLDSTFSTALASECPCHEHGDSSSMPPFRAI